MSTYFFASSTVPKQYSVYLVYINVDKNGKKPVKQWITAGGKPLEYFDNISTISLWDSRSWINNGLFSRQANST